MSFPDEFLWGAAAAAYQIEGAAQVDGRGRSVWDDYCDRDAVKNGDSGAVACDHYHRFEADVDIMRDLELQAYRLSIAWPRVLPTGEGMVNEAGIDFYDRLIDKLLGVGIEPWVTLFHWDQPSARVPTGGWLARDSAHWFADYATLLATRFGDRVTNWITLNEPQVYIDHGHATAVHAPGLTLSLREQLLAGHNTMRAHGLAVAALRAASPQACRIGYTGSGARARWTTIPRPSTRPATRPTGSSGGTTSTTPGGTTRSAPPIPRRARGLAADMPDFPDGDLADMCQPIDFLGLNIYQGGVSV